MRQLLALRLLLAATTALVQPSASQTTTTTTATLSVYRPFFAGDADRLVASFDRWNTFLPCTLANGTPTHSGFPVPLTLFYSRAADANLHASVAAVTTSTGAWRNCFSTISVVGANLTAAMDQYHFVHTDPTWNLGPNLQFYRLLALLNVSNRATPVLYLEPDSVPVKVGWLETLAAEVVAHAPFAVLGSKYAGHNWDALDADAVSPALRNHINGNALYNVSSPLLQDVLAEFAADVNFSHDLQPSYDVAISARGDAATLQAAGYQPVGSIANFAQTLTLPQDINRTAVAVVHGAVYLHNWPDPTCDLAATTNGWYPGTSKVATSASITLVVSEFGNSTAFWNSLATAQANVVANPALNCLETAAHGLPFSEIVVAAQDTDAAHARWNASNYSQGGIPVRVEASRHNPTMDICTVNVTTEWFMLATSDFTVEPDFKLPVETDSNGTLRPLAPYLPHDSVYCTRECKALVGAGGGAPTFVGHHYAQEYAVLSTSKVAAYCSPLLPFESPTIDGYFQFMRTSSRRRRIHRSTPGCTDAFWCGSMVHACEAATVFGSHVRDKCPDICTDCGNADYTAPNATAARELRPTFTWWEDHESGLAYDELYKVYDREKLFVAPTFKGKFVERCENMVDDFADCPCIFPFYYNGAKYVTCTNASNDILTSASGGGGGGPWCPTALTYAGEYLPGSVDVRYCNASDIPPPLVRRHRATTDFTPEKNAGNVTAARAISPAPRAQNDIFIIVGVPIACVIFVVGGIALARKSESSSKHHTPASFPLTPTLAQPPSKFTANANPS